MRIVRKSTSIGETAHKVMRALVHGRTVALAMTLALRPDRNWPRRRHDPPCGAKDRDVFLGTGRHPRPGASTSRPISSLEVTELASTEAGKIAMRAGNADIMPSDWLWVSRERALGAKLTFYPCSSAPGAVMVPADLADQEPSPISMGASSAVGRWPDRQELAAAASAHEAGRHRPEVCVRRIAYGAPPLLAAKVLDGEMDASLNFWNFCAQLEAKGFRRLAGLEDILPKPGARARSVWSALSSMKPGPPATRTC